MCLTCNSVVVLTSDKALRNAAIAAATTTKVTCYVSPFACDFGA